MLGMSVSQPGMYMRIVGESGFIAMIPLASAGLCGHSGGSHVPTNSFAAHVLVG